MAQASETRPHVGDGADLWRGVAAIVLAGVALGLAQNALMRRGETQVGLKDYQRRSLSWVKKPADVLHMADVQAQGVASSTIPSTPPADPEPAAASGATAPAAPLPAVPNLPQPIEMEIAVVKAFFDQDAAAIIDARTREEYAEGHIPGAVSLPFDEAITDPARLESFDAKGRPIIIYCGGGTCEISINLGYALLQAGQKRVLVYKGGYPEWLGAGYPIATGSSTGRPS